IQSYLLDESGAIVRTLDLRKSGKGVRLGANINTRNLSPLRAVAFSCQELSGVGFFDPRFLKNLPNGTIFDARRDTVPQRLNFSLYRGQMACQLEPGIRWQFVLRSGITRNRMALLNMIDPADPAAAGLSDREAIRGFEIGQPPPLQLMHMSARDLYRLDERRLADYARAGISSGPVRKLREHTEEMLAKADAAMAADDGAALARAASGAMANEIRAYQAVRELADDVIRGAIFLLLMLVPFSVAMERLLFCSPRVYRQIAAIMGIFAVMIAVLWSFHPAFRISAQPMMIVLAFAIITMSLMVLSVVYRKFESGLAELRSGRAEASGAQTSRMGVLATAVRLGIASMRKRKLRTALTGLAVMLITFSLLCFMSASSYRGVRQFPLDVRDPSWAPPYTGVLIRQPSHQPMPAVARTFLETILGRDRDISVRLWWCAPAKRDWRLHVRNPGNGRQVSLKAGLGVSASEAKFTRLDEVCPKWPRFAAGGGCYLPRWAAEELRVQPGQPVVELSGKQVGRAALFPDLEGLAYAEDDGHARGLRGLCL
ncbi:hypothetical protein LCGC14_2205430, partial [marine sediment metagenome]